MAKLTQPKRKQTYNRPNGMFLRRVGLLQCIVDYKVQKEVVSTQRAADLAAALKVDKQFLVHELHAIVVQQTGVCNQVQNVTEPFSTRVGMLSTWRRSCLIVFWEIKEGRRS